MVMYGRPGFFLGPCESPKWPTTSPGLMVGCRLMSRCPLGDAHAADGALTFARFAYPPNQLGYCGPDAQDEILQRVSACTSASAGKS